MSEVSAKFPWAEASAQFPELDALLEAKCFSLHEMQVHISTNGVEASALEAASAMSFPALSNSSAKNPIPGVDLSEVSANLPVTLIFLVISMTSEQVLGRRASNRREG